MPVHVVVPRVIPLFIDDVTSASVDRKVAHMDLFAKNLRRVFEARVEAFDVRDLVEFLIAQTRADALGAGSTPEQLQALRLSALRCLLALFADAESYTPATFKAVRAVATRIGQERAARREELQAAYDAEVAAAAAATAVAAPAASAPAAESASEAGAPAAPEAGEQAEAATPEEAAAAAGPRDGAEVEATTNQSDAVAPADAETAPPPDAAQPPTPAASCDAAPAPVAVISSPLPDDPAVPQAHALTLDEALHDLNCRAAVIELFSRWDAAMIDVASFVATPHTLHAYLPHRIATPTRVFRDFLTCTRRPKLTRPWGPASFVHIKTNIKAQSDVMYRFAIEGYNYGVNAAIFSDVVGCTNRRWKEIGNMAQYGWPEGWDAAMTNDYAPGCAVSQYYSRDRFLTIRLRAKSFFSVGFTVSAWMVFHGYGEGFLVAAQVYHQDDDL